MGKTLEEKMKNIFKSIRKFFRDGKKSMYWNLNKFMLSNNLGDKRWNIRDKEETVEKILQGYSISRYGDGEFSMIISPKNISFQEYDSILSKKLFEVLNSSLENHLVAIPTPLIKVDDLIKGDGWYWSKYYFQKKKYLDKILDKNKVYYDAMISRFYMPYLEKTKNIKVIEKLKNYFENKDILILEGENTRFGLGNELLKKSKRIRRIILPARDSFSKYNEILEEVKNNYSQDVLLLIALGPTATVLAYDFCKLGYQALDIGHMDIEFEWYLAGATQKIDLPNKSVNEVTGVVEKQIQDSKLEDIYNKQIVKKIL